MAARLTLAVVTFTIRHYGLGITFRLILTLNLFSGLTMGFYHASRMSAIILAALMFLHSVSLISAGPVASAACATVCGAAWACCAFGSGVAIAACPITAPFAAILLPMFSGGGCTAGYATCMGGCGTLLIVPTP